MIAGPYRHSTLDAVRGSCVVLTAAALSDVPASNAQGFWFPYILVSICCFVLFSFFKKIIAILIGVKWHRPIIWMGASCRVLTGCVCLLWRGACSGPLSIFELGVCVWVWMNFLFWVSVLCQVIADLCRCLGSLWRTGFHFSGVWFTFPPCVACAFRVILKKKKSLPALMSCVFFKDFCSFSLYV